MELFQREIRVQAMQNAVFIAMCNRVGMEGAMEFAGQSMVAHPSGELVCMADDREQLVTCDIDLREAASWRKSDRISAAEGRNGIFEYKTAALWK